MTNLIVTDNYQKILHLLKVEENFDFEAYKLPMLIRRIDNRILKTNSENPKKYLLFLRNTEGEAKQLINNFMINVSHFFRDPLTFEFLKHRVLPELMAQVKTSGKNSLRIWSAGCAKGEEAYTMAMLIDEYCAKERLTVGVDFFATDYDSSALEYAQFGEYYSKSVEETKLKYLEKYFTKVNDRYCICSGIKSKIQFSTYNLLDKSSYAPDDSIFGEFDLVLCRNVLIYFNEDSQSQIFDKLHKSLLQNKILVLGEAEVPPSSFLGMFHQINDCCKIYRKID